MTGNLISDATSGGSINLFQGTKLTGMIDPYNVTVHRTSIWNMTESSLVDFLDEGVEERALLSARKAVVNCVASS